MGWGFSFRSAGCLLLAACAAVPARVVTAGAAPPPGAALDAEIRDDMAVQHAIAWSASRPLAWSDFQDQMPASAGDEGAVTAYSLFYGIRCVGDRFAARVTTGFFPRASWVNPEVLADADLSQRTLHHEQTHFNLAEAYARRMRKYFGEVYDPCGLASARLSDTGQQFVRDEMAAQGRYDDETRHGLDAVHQAQWDRDVAEQLQTLDAFSEQAASAHDRH